MKVAFILPSLANRGPIVFTKYLIEGLRPKVSFIKVFYFKDIVELDLGVDVQKIEFFERINFKEYDIVHTTMLKPDLYCFFHVDKNKVVGSMHNYLEEDLGFIYSFIRVFIYKKLWFIALKSFKNIIVSSEDMFNYYKNKLGEKQKMTVIPYGISRKALKPIDNKKEIDLFQKLKSTHTIIGTCGLLIKRKGFEQLVKVLKKSDSIVIVVIGEGEEMKNLQSLAKELQVEDRFILLGFKDNSIDYYKYFDIYAMTSYSEGFGLAMLEAMSQKLPIVCSNLPLYKNYFGEDEASLFEPKNIESLSEAIRRVIKDLDYYKSRSFQLFEKTFSLKVMCEKHLELYKKITSLSK